MADVKPPRVRGTDPEPDEDRAQLILITGLTLAVILVAVVLLLNTVIYTENLATRGVDAGGADAVDFRDGAAEDVAAIMEREHRNENASGDVVANFTASTAVYADTVAGLRARDGVIADIDVRSINRGYFIAQEPLDDGSRRNMTDPDGIEDWTVAGNTTRTRAYQLTVSAESLAGADSFSVVATRPNETWSMSLSDGPTTGEINVTVDNGTEAVTETFADPGDGNHTIDVTGGTVNGEPFEALVWAENVQTGTDDYDVRYENGDEAVGTYSLVVDDRDGGAEFDRPTRPYIVEGVYSAEIAVSRQTPELEYSDVVRVAPGERDA